MAATWLRATAAALALCAAPAAAAAAEVAYVDLGEGAQGLLWRPAAGTAKARVGLALLHPYFSSLSHIACREMADRGYVVLCADPPTVNRPHGYGSFEAQAPAIRAAIRRLRAEAGVERVALVGHGAGAAMMAFHQNVAKNGPAAACQGPEKIMPCDAARLTRLEPADALVLLDPEPGQAFTFLSGLDPAIESEAAPGRRTMAVDMFDTRNGFDPGRNAGEYTSAFRKTFLERQAARAAEIGAQARRKLTAVAARDPDSLADDMPLFVPGATSARLWQADVALLAHTRRAHRLLTAAGPKEAVLRSVRLPSGAAREASSLRAAARFTARTFLAGHAIATTADYDITADDITGVVWESSSTSAGPNLTGVTEPLLVMAMTANHLLRPAEMLFDAAGAADKELVGVEGASHAITPCAACASAPGQFGDTVKATFDHVAAWLAARF